MGDNIKLDLQEVGWGHRFGLIWLRIGTGGVSSECGNKPSGSIKCEEFRDYMMNLLKKDPVPWNLNI
jgi:hypothetical protein